LRLPEVVPDSQPLWTLDVRTETDTHDGLFTETLWKTLYRRAYAFVRHRENAEDLAQETCLKLWRELKSGRRFEFLGAWLNTVLRHAMLRQGSGSRPALFIPLQVQGEAGSTESSIDVPDPSPSVLDALMESDRAQEESRLLCQVVLVLKEMPENERDCIILSARGYSFVQIAKALNVDYRTAIKMTGRAVATIRSKVEGESL
jgi:RNA polymerase sigma factor (sigma-70 family)